MNACAGKRLDPGRKSPESTGFEGGLRRKIVWQDEAVQAVVDLYQVFRASLNSLGRPVWVAASEGGIPSMRKRSADGGRSALPRETNGAQSGGTRNPSRRH